MYLKSGWKFRRGSHKCQGSPLTKSQKNLGYPVPGSEIVVKSRSVKRNAKNAATAPLPKSRPSYFPFARFNTSALYYLRAWVRGCGTG